MRARSFLIVASLAALALAGCGGDDGGDEAASTPVVATITAAPSLSKEELISQGDAICAEVNAALASVSSNTTSSESQVSQVADLYIGMVDSLQGLGTPDDDAGYDEVMSAADDLAQAESDAKLADERGDSAALSTAQTEATSAVVAFQAAAGSYGFTDCSESPGAAVPSTTTDPSAAATTPTTTTPTAPSTTPATPTPAPSTGGAGGTAGTGGGSTGGGTAGSTGGGTTGGSSGGIGPG
ncbi:MAG TPA: hypothetical protein VNM89_07320 [Solirubrobacterales bacterium]|nr:hypothetical protein [Solirubrobacterales bacterium]